jgi:hypothetical protein
METNRRRGSILPWIAGVALVAPPAAAQAPALYQIAAQDFDETIGTDSDAAGDLDGDGVPDLILAGANVVRTYSGTDMQLIHDIPGTLLQGINTVSGLGDVNQDGYGDFVVGLPYLDWGGQSESGGLRVFSGKTGSVIYFIPGPVIPGPGGAPQLGTDVDGAGDVDGDGVPDFIAGAPFDQQVPGTIDGTARVYSGATGGEIWILTGLYGGGSGEEFGYRVSGVGDIDQDGQCDLVAAPLGVNFQPGLSYVLVHSGASGQLMTTIPSPVTGDLAFGKALHPAGDIDGDGVPDLVVGSSGGGIDPYQGFGSVYVFRGTDIAAGGSPAPFMSFVGDAPQDYLGIRVSGNGDLDGDGVPDILATAWQCGGNGSCIGDPGYMRGWSGADGSVLFTNYGFSTIQDGYGASCAIIGDLNGDGRAEYGVGAPEALTVGMDSGRYDVHTASSPDLLVTAVEFSLAAGGDQTLRLKPGAQYAGAPYLLLGTASNIWPGTAADGLTVPLNVDAYTLLTLAAPNVPPLSASFGLLGPDAKATAHFAFPPGSDPTLAGVTLHHAYVLFGEGLSISLASNAAPLVLVP